MDAIDPALRRSGRFDAEIEVTAPTEDERYQILMVSDILANAHLKWSFIQLIL